MKRQKSEDRSQSPSATRRSGKSISPVSTLTNKVEAGLRGEKGIALVMVLLLSLIALAFVSAMLFMITQGTKLSGAYRVFKSAEDASFGGTEIVQDYMSGKGDLFLPLLIVTDFRCVCDANSDGNVTTNDNHEWKVSTNTDMGRSCRCDKLCTGHFDSVGASNWTVCAADDSSLDPTAIPDLQFTLGVAPNVFDVFAKIVDTVEGNSDMGGLVTGGGSLGGGGVVASNTGLINPPQSPYLYRIEVQAQAAVNVRERSRLSILYAY